MKKELACLVIHGIGRQEPDFANDLIAGVSAQVQALGHDPEVLAWQSVSRHVLSANPGMHIIGHSWSPEIGRASVGAPRVCVTGVRSRTPRARGVTFGDIR